MAIATPKFKVKVICKSCGWHLIAVHHSPILGPAPVVPFFIASFDIIDLLTLGVPLCGHCGSRDLLKCAASTFEHLNPTETVRKLAYIARLPGLLKKYPDDEGTTELVSNNE